MAPIELAVVAAAGWFAFNMGSSGLAPAFGPVLGARIVTPRWAALAFGGFVVLGAVVFGSPVARTLAADLIPVASFDLTATLVVLIATNIALLIANLVGIPQSTSWVTVAAIAALGLYGGNLSTHAFTHRLLPAWIVFPLASFVLTVAIVRAVYPLYGARSRLHSWLHQHTRTLRGLAIGSACYVALAIGANNVANAAGPLAATGLIDASLGLLVLAPLFGVGAFVLRGPARTIARDVVPLGLLTATLCNLVVASLLLTASWMGVPQSLVQLNAAAVLGVALVKEGRGGMFDGRGTRRMFVLWIVTPIVAATLTHLGLLVVR